MKNMIITCPCCGKKIEIQFESGGNPTVFLVDKSLISQAELSEKYGIELGVVEGGENGTHSFI